MFEKLNLLHDNKKNKLPVQIENGILKHLSTLESEFEKYFPEITNDELDFVINPFTFPVEKFSDECQDEFSELVNDSSARQAYYEKLLIWFWSKMKDSYSKTTKKVLCILTPFYVYIPVCSAFSTLLQIKTKQRNRLDVKNDLHCALSQTIPCIQQLSHHK